MFQTFLCLSACISIFYASGEGFTSVEPEAPQITVVTVLDESLDIAQETSDGRVSTISETGSHAPYLDNAAFSTPEDLAHEREVPELSVRTSSLHEPISPDRDVGNRNAHLGFTLTLPSTPRPVADSQIQTGSSLNLSQRFKDGVRNAEWEKALAEIPEDVKVVPSACVQGFKRAYTSLADGLSLFSLVIYGMSGVASGLGGVDYLSNNAFLPPEVMVTVVGLGLIGTVLFRYLWISLSYVKKMDQKRLVSYERRAQELETEQYTDAQLTEKFERANIFLMYPSRSMVTARQFLFNFVCCSETVSSTLLAISGGVFATSAVSGITGKDLLHMGSQDLYLGISQGSALAYTIVYLLHEKAKDLKDRCEAWLTVQQLAKLYLIQVSGIEKDKIYDSIHDLQDHLKRGHENLLIA